MTLSAWPLTVVPALGKLPCSSVNGIHSNPPAGRTWDFSKLKITGGSAGTVDSDDATVCIYSLPCCRPSSDFKHRFPGVRTKAVESTLSVGQ